MALGFRSAMHSVVFRSRNDLEITRVVALQTAHELNTKLRGEVRILAVRLLPSPPARIAKNVDVWTPESQALVTAELALARILVMLCACLGRDNVGDLVHQFCVPGRGEANGLWKHSRNARSGHAMQGLIPVVVSRNAETFNRWRSIPHLRDFFFKRQARQKIVDASRNRQVRIFVRR